MAMKTGDRMTGVRNKKYFAFLHNWPCMSQLLVMGFLTVRSLMTDSPRLA